MTASKHSRRPGLRLLRWACAALLVAVSVLVADAAPRIARGSSLWARLRDFTAAFGGMIGVALLLAGGVALLFLIDRFLFREEETSGQDGDAR